MTPIIHQVVPGEGPADGGTDIIITGVNLGGTVAVTVGGIAAVLGAVTAASVTATTAAGPPGPALVRVSDGARTGSLADGFAYRAPQVVAVSRPSGPTGGGTNLTITGSFFVNGSAVTFGGVPAATVLFVNDTRLDVVTPPHAAALTTVAVVTPGGHTGALNNAYTFSPPDVTALQPADGSTSGGYNVTVRGTDFVGGGLRVVFGATDSPTVAFVDDQTITAEVPAGVAGAVPVTVVDPAGYTGAAIPFTYHLPTVTGVNPASGLAAGGETVQVAGTYFAAGAALAVSFNGGNAPLVTFRGATQLDVTTPVHAGGQVGVTVTNPDGQSAVLAASFEFLDPPQVATIAPNAGRDTGGRAVTITGANFRATPTVEIGGVAATNVTWVGATTLTAIVPAQAAGPAVAVRVINPDGQEHTLAAAFTYHAGPPPSNNEVTFLMDGEEFFEELRLQMVAMTALPPNPATYVRMAFWKIADDVTLGDRTHYDQVADLLVRHIDAVLQQGHDVDIIVWYPNRKDRAAWGNFAVEQTAFADAVMLKDATHAGVVGHGRARVYLERYEGWLGTSNHEKFAIFSNAGIRTVVMGGLNVAQYYFDSADHHYRHRIHNRHNVGWHDTAIRLVGPATDEVEAEWMRRWQRAVDMQASITLNTLENQVRSRYTGVGSSQTIRQRAVAITQNQTPQPIPVGANAAVRIALTRSVRGTRYRELRDLLIERIQNANDYVYMENNQFTDPEIVAALYSRLATIPLLRIRVVTNPRGGGEGYMTRRSWLQLVLRMPAPVLQRVHYLSKRTGVGLVQIARATAAVWNVIDSYDANALNWASWLTGDALQVSAASGGTKLIAFSKIRAVESTWHFYTPICRYYGRPVLNIPTVHSKLAVIDGQHMVVGSPNWTYRSMQYDGEIAAYIDGGGFATAALARILAHWDAVGAASGPLHLAVGVPDNFEATANQNILDRIANGNAYVGDDDFRLFPLCDHRFALGNVPNPPGTSSMPSFTWI